LEQAVEFYPAANLSEGLQKVNTIAQSSKCRVHTEKTGKVVSAGDGIGADCGFNPKSNFAGESYADDFPAQQSINAV
jgi:hypothetical protein